jgi:hypothetical protein
LHAVDHRIPVRKPGRRVDVGLDAKKLDLQLLHQGIGDLLVGVPEVAIGAVESERRGDDEAVKCDAGDPQSQQPGEVQAFAPDEWRRERGFCNCHGRPRKFRGRRLHAYMAGKKLSNRGREICPLTRP